MDLTRALIRRQDRARGSGWLDCPSCHEHASQDVVDEMTFACLTFYRLSPIHRRRMLLCRKCGYRRPATAEEMQRLETAGQRVRAAWLVPIGATPFVIAALVAVLVGNRTTQADSGISYGKQDAVPVARASFELPIDFNHSADLDVTPHTYTATNAPGTLVIHLRRFEVNEPADGLLAEHLSDDKSVFQDTEYPEAVDQSKLEHVKVGGVDALHVRFDYKHANDDAQQSIYALVHNGVSYTIDVTALGKASIDDNRDVEKHFVDSFSFDGNNETAAPAPSPSPGTSPSPGGSASPGTSASPSAAGSGSSSSATSS